MNFFKKIIFKIKKPIVVFIDKDGLKEGIYKLIKKRIKNVIVLNFDNENLEFIFKNSNKIILVVSDIRYCQKALGLIKKLPQNAKLILNYDFSETRALRKEKEINILTFGLFEGSDIRITDIKTENQKLNFKLNYSGAFIPVWIKINQNQKIEDRTFVYDNLVIISIAISLNFNLVEISQFLKQ